MKKVILSIAIVFALAITVTSCKKESKATTTTKAVATEVYQCPMDCEKGKSYTKAGSCPFCKMDLKSKTAG